VLPNASSAKLQFTATRCNTLQRTEANCNTLKHTATHCNTLQHFDGASDLNAYLHLTASHCNSLQLIAIHCDTLTHVATHCITLQCIPPPRQVEKLVSRHRGFGRVKNFSNLQCGSLPRRNRPMRWSLFHTCRLMLFSFLIERRH